MTNRHALLIGATGLVGRHLLRSLLDHPAWARVTVLARRGAAREQERLDWRVVDFDDGASWGEIGPVTDLFNAMGTTIKQAGSRAAFRRVDLEIPLAVARAARAAGARHVSSVSSLGADARSRIFYSRIKGELEEALTTLGFDSVHHLRPSLLLGERDRARAGEKVAEVALGLVRPFMLGGLRRYRGIRGEAVARAAVTLAATAEPGVRVVLSDELAQVAAGI